MLDIWQQLIKPHNLPFSFAFGMLCLYWCISIIGIFDFAPDAEVDIDPEVNGDAHWLGEGVKSILHFVNAADVPVMLILTIISGVGLALNVLLNSLFNAAETISMSVAMFFVSLVLSAILSRYLTLPLRPIFRALRKDEEIKIAIVGRLGKVKTSVLDHDFGQVEVPHENNSPTLLNCVLAEHHDPLKKGDHVLIVEFDEERKKYIASPARELVGELSSSLVIEDFDEIHLNKTTTITKENEQ